MRPKVVFILFVFLLAAGLVAVYFRRQPVVPPMPVISAVTNSIPSPTEAPVPVVVKKAVTAEARQEAIEAEKNRLFDWETKDDDQSLSNILGDLTSPEKEVRLAAIEATKQFGSSNAIPVLKGVAANTEDTDEQKALLDAADFLALTPMGSYSGPKLTPTPEQIQRQKAADALHQNHLQQQRPHGQGQNADGQNTAGQNQTPQP